MDTRFIVLTVLRVAFGLVLLRRDSDNPFYELIYVLAGLFLVIIAVTDIKDREYANRKDRRNAPYF